MRKIYELDNLDADDILVKDIVYIEKTNNELFKIHDKCDYIYLTESGAYDLFYALAEMLEFKLE